MKKKVKSASKNQFLHMAKKKKESDQNALCINFFCHVKDKKSQLNEKLAFSSPADYYTST